MSRSNGAGNKSGFSISEVPFDDLMVFQAREAFSKAKLKERGVSVKILNREFYRDFIRNGGKIEQTAKNFQLYAMHLSRKMSDTSIITRLGGEKKAYVKLSLLYELICRQRNMRHPGILLMNGNLNICYIHNREGILRSVFAFFLAGEWVLGSVELNSNDPGWGEGSQVVSLDHRL